MGYEIDIMAIGDGERGGDAIAIRFGNLSGDRSQQYVIIIDGGTKETGQMLVQHVQKYYGTDTVDLVICTHPDADHSSGLTEVLENLKIRMFCIHRPWEYTQQLKNYFAMAMTNAGLESRLKKSLDNVHELEQLARKRKIDIGDPFSDEFQGKIEGLIILSPSKEFYKYQLANFRETPDPKERVAILEKAFTAVKSAINWISEKWGLETLTDPEENATSAENNSGVIILLQVENEKILFTGDAGVEALQEAINKAKELGIDLKSVNYIQVPHHGSKHNVGPSILNELIGPKLDGEICSKSGFISAPKKGDPKHPSRKVTNAFKRRGVKLFVTQGTTLCYSKNAPVRDWTAVEPIPFYAEVEE